MELIFPVVFPASDHVFLNAAFQVTAKPPTPPWVKINVRRCPTTGFIGAPTKRAAVRVTETISPRVASIPETRTVSVGVCRTRESNQVPPCLKYHLPTSE